MLPGTETDYVARGGRDGSFWNPGGWPVPGPCLTLTAAALPCGLFVALAGPGAFPCTLIFLRRRAEKGDFLYLRNSAGVESHSEPLGPGASSSCGPDGCLGEAQPRCHWSVLGLVPDPLALFVFWPLSVSTNKNILDGGDLPLHSACRVCQLDLGVPQHRIGGPWRTDGQTDLAGAAGPWGKQGSGLGAVCKSPPSLPTALASLTAVPAPPAGADL